MAIDDEPPWVDSCEPPRWPAPAWLGEVEVPRTRAGAPISKSARLRWLAALEAGGAALAPFEAWLCPVSTRVHTLELLTAWATHGSDPRHRWLLAGLRRVDERDLEARLASEPSSSEVVRAAIEAPWTRLENALCTGRDWSVADWRYRVVEHPLVHHGVRGLVWAVRSPDGALTDAFLLGRDGRPVGLDGEPVAVDPRARVGLLHPAEIEPPARRAWGERLAEAELVQPFAQLARGVWAPEPEDAAGDTLSRFPRGSADADDFVARLHAQAWIRGEPDARMRTRYFFRPFPRASAYAVLSFEPGLPSEAAQRVQEAFFVSRRPGGVRFATEPRLPLVEVEARAVSELLHDLGALAG